MSTAAEHIEPTVYEIPAHRLSLFEEKFASLQKRASKLGCPIPSFELGELATKKRIEQDLDGELFVTFFEYYPVTVSGAAPSFSGWSFLAVVDYEAAAPMFRKTPAADAHEIPDRYRTLGPVCEHCRLDRNRKETFVVRHESGDVKQVGRRCIRDFLGHDSPENVAAMAMFETEVSEALGGGEEGEGLFSGPFTPDITSYLAWVVRSVRLWGWLSRRAALEEAGGQPSTASAASEAFEKYLKACREGRADRAAKPTDADKERAAAVLAWARTLGDGEDRRLSDYEHNLRAAATLSQVGPKHRGLVASAVAAYDREAARRRAVKQEHVGIVGERLRGVRVYVDRVFRFESSPFGAARVVMRDLDGHVFTWVTASIPDTGREYTMTATVKEHGEYKGTFQTVVSRAELLADDEPTKAERRTAEVLSQLLSDCMKDLERLGWSNGSTFSERRHEATSTVNLVELEALRSELHAIAGVIEPAVELSAHEERVFRLGCRSVQARLAAVDPNRKVRKLKPADKAIAHQLLESIRTAADADPAHWPDRPGLLFLTIAQHLADDIATLRALRAEMRAFVEESVFVPRGYSDNYWQAQFDKNKALALAALTAEIEAVPGANPAAAARIAKPLRRALSYVMGWPFEWAEAAAFEARIRAAEERSDVAALEALRSELSATISVMSPCARAAALGTVWSEDRIVTLRAEAISLLGTKVRGGATMSKAA